MSQNFWNFFNFVSFEKKFKLVRRDSKCVTSKYSNFWKKWANIFFSRVRLKFTVHVYLTYFAIYNLVNSKKNVAKNFVKIENIIFTVKLQLLPQIFFF